MKRYSVTIAIVAFVLLSLAVFELRGFRLNAERVRLENARSLYPTYQAWTNTHRSTESFSSWLTRFE